MYQVLCKLFIFFLNLPHITSSIPPLCPSAQSFSLLQFKNSFTFNPLASKYCDDYGLFSYPKMKSWKEGIDCCSWDGVKCDRVTGHVIGLDLSCSWLQGSIHSNSSLFLLPHLQILDLAYNNFSSSRISSKFGLFASLTRLNLSESEFSGRVPSEISHLSKLVSLDLSSNSIRFEQHSFNLLVHNLTRLQEVLLGFVDMSSVVPSSLTNLSSSLTILSLQVCGLKGKFPDKIFSLTKLQILDLSYNNDLTGYFPKSNWSSPLKHIHLVETSFSGELPHSIGNLKSLKHLDLDDCNFTGSVPASLGNLTQLVKLDLSSNHFSGHFPDVFASLKNLVSFSLYSNGFRGQLPSSIFNLTQIAIISVSFNQLGGPIHYPIIHLPNLEQLALSHNLINGTIPSWLFALPSLVDLDLHQNQLTGTLSEFQYNSLEVIKLSNNKLHGPIPTSIFELVHLTDLYLSSNNLSGNIDLDMFSKLKNLTLLYLSDNSLSLSTNKNNMSYWPQITFLGLSSCNITEFPYLLRTSENLGELDLSNNKIHGQIPKWMLDLGKDSLYSLNLSHNFLTGGLEQLPWRQLLDIDLNSNMLQGSLPELLPSLRSFSISNNGLTGEIPLSLCNMSSLLFLDLSNNSLNGIIPHCLGNFSDNLWVLNLRMNSFHGIIPQTFHKCKSLRNLGLNDNRLEGSLPQSLTNCKKLEVLDLGNNKINATFPHWLETSPKLQVLILRSNQFYGPIRNPKGKFSFPELRIFDVSNNRFSGLLPSKYFSNLRAMMLKNEGTPKSQYMESKYGGPYMYYDSVMVTMKGSNFPLVKILTIFTTIDLSNNSFRGGIPSNIGKLKSLKGLNISHNNLTGRIPSLLGNLKNLEWLDLSSNKLVGEIPRQLVDLSFLEVLNLSQNRLVGSIPRGKQFDTFKSDCYEGNLGLCGFPLPNACSRDDEPSPQSPLNMPQEEDDSNGFSWKIAFMGYGCGTVFGFSMGYIMLSTQRPRWLVNMIEGQRYKKVKIPNKNARSNGWRSN